tara:strand:+ start:1975 stop:2145 length:171 start_codon:yes stop_codon:yes gene_type:complete
MYRWVAAFCADLVAGLDDRARMTACFYQSQNAVTREMKANRKAWNAGLIGAKVPWN